MRQKVRCTRAKQVHHGIKTSAARANPRHTVLCLPKTEPGRHTYRGRQTVRRSVQPGNCTASRSSLQQRGQPSQNCRPATPLRTTAWPALQDNSMASRPRAAGPCMHPVTRTKQRPVAHGTHTETARETLDAPQPTHTFPFKPDARANTSYWLMLYVRASQMWSWSSRWFRQR